MVKCAKCGCNLSGEIKKGKYIYYSCTGGKGECEQQHIYIKEGIIENQILEALSNITISKEQSEWIKAVLKESLKDEHGFTIQQINSLRVRQDKLRDRIDNLYID